MTVPRSRLVNPTMTCFYHCISRCVRGGMLCGGEWSHRKQWLENRLEVLSRQFAISVCGFSVMDNHFHVLVRLDPEVAAGWSDQEVISRWAALCPPKKVSFDDPEAKQMWIEQQAKDKKLVACYRSRLQDLGWFMKALKEPLARLANREDDCTGSFWQGRYKSIAILDLEALLMTCAYIDLNPFAAGLAATPEQSQHTSLALRILHAQMMGKLDQLSAATLHSLAGSAAAGSLEDSHWLCPLEDRRRKGSLRAGMMENVSLGSYLLLVDYTSRLCRAGKAQLPTEVASIFERLETSAEYWRQRMAVLFSKTRWFGVYFGTKPERLRKIADQRGVHHVDNLVTIATAG